MINFTCVMTCCTSLVSSTSSTYVRHDSVILVAHLHVRAHSHVTHDLFICMYASWSAGHHVCRLAVAPVRDMTHWYVWHGAFTCDTWLIAKRRITHSHVCMFLMCSTSLVSSTSSFCVRQDSLICVTWLIYTWDMTHSRVCMRRDVQYITCVVYL